jgi:hypothetical protein
MRAIVIAGPSIHGIEQTLLANVDLRPPAACGDILRACRDMQAGIWPASAGPASIGLVDGVFESRPSVWHKEILFALTRGIAVFGAASMGALRAAECHSFGMRGVGAIFEQYRTGRRIADADVAVLHAPPELAYRPLTVALVDVEATLAQLSARQLLAQPEAAALLDAAAALHFKERTWPRVLDRAEIAGARRHSVEQLLATGAVSQKAVDARELIVKITASDPYSLAVPAIEQAELSRTIYLDMLARRVLPEASAGDHG